MVHRHVIKKVNAGFLSKIQFIRHVWLLSIKIVENNQTINQKSGSNSGTTYITIPSPKYSINVTSINIIPKK
jgi:hypothetical protein